MKVKAVVITLIGAAVVAILALGYASPYLALNRAKRAADERDAATLSRYVDFPALRASLKQQLSGKLMQNLAPKAAHNPLALLGEMVGQAVISPLVDAYATPDGVAAILNGMPPSTQPGSQGENRPAPGAEPPSPGSTPPSAPRQPPDTTAGYRSLNQFVVTYRHGIGDTAYQAIFERHGLFSWQLSAVDLGVASSGQTDGSR